MDTKAQSGFNRTQQGCIDKALAELKGLSESDIKNFTDKAVAYQKENGGSLEDAVNHLTKELGEAFKTKARLIEDQYNKLYSPSFGWYNKIVGKKLKLNDILTNDTLKSRGLNVEDAQKSQQVAFRRQLFGNLSKEAQNTLLASSKSDEIWRALDGIQSKDPIVNEIASAFKSIKDSVDANLIDSGALPFEDHRNDYKFGIKYDPMKLTQRPTIMTQGKAMLQKIAKGEKIEYKPYDQTREEFIDTMIKEADTVKMFGADYADEDVAREAFGNMFDSINRGASVNKDLGQNIRVEADLQKRQTQFFVPKNWQSYGRILAKYGKAKSPLEQVMNHLNSSGAQIGMSRILGADPYRAFNILLDAEHKTYGKESKVLRPQNVFAELTGYTSTPVSPQLAQMAANFRAITGMARQVPLTIASLNDTNMGLQAITDITRSGYCQNFLTKTKFIADAYAHATGKERETLQRTMMNLSHSLKAELGAMARFTDSMNTGDITRKMASWFYNIIGMTQKDEGNIVGASYLIGKEFGDFRGSSFNDLPAVLQNRLKAFDVSEPEWETLRHYIDKNDFEEKLMYPDVVDGISDTDMDGLAHEIAKQRLAATDTTGMDDDQIEKLQSSFNPGSLQARAELTTKLYAMLENAANETVLYPGVTQRAIMNQGIKSGTPVGELLRSIFQFKGFMLSYINRILINGYKQDTSKMKWNWAMTNFVYTLPLTYMSNVLYNAATGRDLNADPLNWNADDWVNNLIPGVGMLTKSLNPKTQNNSFLYSTLLQSPSLSDLSDLMALGGSAVNLARPSTGDIGQRADRLKGKASQVVSDFTPINSMPLAGKWWRDNMISTRS